MLSHGSSGRGGRGRGYQGRGHGVVHGGSRGGCEVGVRTRGTINSWNNRGSRYCHHCQRAGHTEAYCYTLHPKLKPPLAAYAEVEDSLSPPSMAPPSSTQVLKTGDPVTLTRAEYDTLVRSQQVTGSLAPTATLAQTSKGSSSCLLSTSLDSWVIDSGATNHMTGNSNLLYSFHSTSPSLSNSVTLANGSQPQVTGSEDWTDDWWGT
ncbi:hypothetical protein ACJRO7_032360 [Eucalyptus globulus]|uniref:Retrovirus-related Pol polyprotein from transposon TNT 1-94-like beta-barrel domain-containing protein n=1 Tax=Eucalyptus globulus TaxID=34317 RepID=A0ABD3JKJ8_EUCGL